MLRLGENRLDSSRQRLQIAKASNKAIIFLRILGLFPYKYSRKDFVICRSGIVFQWLTFAILLIVTMFMCYISITLIVFDTLLLKIERLESSILALVAFSLLILQRKRLLSVVNQILHFSSELLDVSLINRGVKLLFLIQLSISLIFLGVLHVTPIGLALYYVETNYLTVSSDLLYAARFIATFMYFNVECFLIYFLVILRACFFAVDSFFASAAMEESNGVDKSTVALRRIVLLRQKLLEMVIEVNVLFSPVLIMSSGFTLSQLLFSSYLGVSYLLAGDYDDIETAVFYKYLLVSFFFHSLRFSLLCWACHALSNESNGAVVKVHRLINSLPSKAERTKRRLFEYSFALRNCPYNITAMGFFIIDLRLCLNMISGLATYLIILLQFRFTPPPQNN